MAQQRIVIPGSEASHSGGGSWLPVDPDHIVKATILIRRPPSAGDVGQRLLSGSWPQLSRDQAETFLRVDPTDLAAVLAFVQNHGLTIVAENADARTVQVEGSAKQIGQAFGVEISERIDPEGHQYLSYQGALSVPAELSGVVEAVLGLDQRPVARRGAAQ
jgi:kumamolisin